MKKIRVSALPIALFFSMISSASALEYQSPRTLGLGGAGRAAPWLTDTIHLNPSFGSFSPIYALSGGYQRFDTGRVYNISVQDSRNDVLQAGVGFTKRDLTNALNLGASRAFMNKWGIGLGTKLLFDQPSNQVTYDFSLSASILASSWLNASVLIENLIAGSPQVSRKLDRTLYLGFKLAAVRKIDFYFDPLFSPSYSRGEKFGFSLGAEVGMLTDMYLRLGRYVNAEVSHLNTRGTGFGIGAAWVGPKISLEYALSRTTQSHSGLPLSTAHSGSVIVFF